MNDDDARHGKVAGYIAKCRCSACSLAWFRYCKRRRALLDQGKPLTVPGVGFQRRVRALQAIGWSLAAIAGEHGSTGQKISDTMGRATVTVRTHQRMVETFNRLSMTPGPSRSARIRAAGKGWAPPLAWDDIDDPEEAPYVEQRGQRRAEAQTVDRVIVERAMRGERVQANPAERAEVLRRWRAAGRSVQELDIVQGWNMHRDVRTGKAAA